MWPLYHAGMYLFVLCIRITSFWNAKSRLWIEGRKNWKEKLQSLPSKKDFRIWVHVSSLGEFEQARSVIEKIKISRPATEIILSFFSPSGYTFVKGYDKAMSVMYLPSDLPGNAAKWLSGTDPDMAVFVKYDLWPGFIRELHRRKIQSILIAAHWEPGRMLGSWNTPLTKEILKKFDRIFFQQSYHLDYFRQKGFKNLSVAGDSRIDRSLNIPSESVNKIPWLPQSGVHFDIVAGSTWPEDENLILESISTLNLRAIIAPHDVSPDNIKRLRRKIGGKHQVLSEMKGLEKETSVILVDSVGLLSSLYSLGRIAYVGGGFGKGIHNILEPMAHSKAVIFGPYFKRFPEAVDAISLGAAFTIKSQQELLQVIQTLYHADHAAQSGMKSRAYLENHAGASDVIANYILDSIPFRPK